MNRLVGYTRFLVLLGVVGNMLAATVLFVSGIVQGGKVLLQITGYLNDAKGMKRLAIESVQLADYFLIATALYIVAVGLYELFVGELKLPAHLNWLKVTSIDALKDRLIGVIVTVLAVTFLAVAANWNGEDVLSFGLALAAVIVALGIFRWLSRG
jgi:uncharacterized membrane protein YqhA